MQDEDFEREIKVLVIGNGGVGKTSMIRRFCKGIFTDEYKKTIGVDFLEKHQYVSALGEDVRFMLWDTAGQEEFDSLTRGYYRGAGAAVLAFSTIDRASFDAIVSWREKVTAECGDIAMALVQNKVDLIDQAAMTNDDVENLARKLNLKLYRTCVKENVNVVDVFVYLAELHTKKLAQGHMEAQPATPTIAGRTQSSTAKTPEFGESKPPQVVDLQPSKQRTGGKKRLKDKCSIL